MPALIYKKSRDPRRPFWYIVENSTVDGKQMRERLESLGQVSKSEAKQQYIEYMYKLKNGGRIVPKQWCYVYAEFKEYYKAKSKDSMYELCVWYLDKFTGFERTFMAGIDEPAISKRLMHLKEHGTGKKGWSGRTLNIMSDQIKKVFRFAVDSRYMRESELPRMPRFSDAITKKTPRISLDEIKRLLLNANNDQRFTLLFYINTGIRAFEFTRLLPEHINFVDRYVRIESDSKLKTARLIPMTTDLYDLLLEFWKDILERERVSPWATTSGCYIALRRLTKKEKESSGGDTINITLKGLRKTFGSLMAQNRMPAPVLQRVMGHSKFETTQKHYIEYDNSFLLEEMEKYKIGVTSVSHAVEYNVAE